MIPPFYMRLENTWEFKHRNLNEIGPLKKKNNGSQRGPETWTHHGALVDMLYLLVQAIESDEEHGADCVEIRSTPRLHHCILGLKTLGI